MMEDWVDDCWRDMDMATMVLSGDEFKEASMRPHEVAVVGYAGPQSGRKIRTYTESRGLDLAVEGRCHFSVRAPTKCRGSLQSCSSEIGDFSARQKHTYYAAIAKRNSDRLKHTTVFKSCW